MIVFIAIGFFLVFAMLAYPFWLYIMAKNRGRDTGLEAGMIDGVSIILLSYNGAKYLEAKINFFLRELGISGEGELIVVDDCSNDGTAEILDKFQNISSFISVRNPVRKGIPYAMNLGVQNAKYNCIVFSDQRQFLSEGIVGKIIEPLKFARVGAVSGCISCCDKGKHVSLLRRFENSLKTGESEAGSLIGVYGPFYAIKKSCYCRIPENIILDDLYLSLCVLKSKEIILAKECNVIDDNFTELYDYRRAKRYLAGLLQLLDKKLFSGLNWKCIMMLLWHKYLRLFVPLYMFAFYMFTAIQSPKDPAFFIGFSLLTALGFTSFLNNSARVIPVYVDFVRINIFYLVAIADLLLGRGLLNVFSSKGHKPGGFSVKYHKYLKQSASENTTHG